MQKYTPLFPISGIIAFVLLLTAMFSKNPVTLGCNGSRTEVSQPRDFESLSRDEKIAALEQLFMDPENGGRSLSVLLDEEQFNRFVQMAKPDAETLEILNELRQKHQFKWKAPEEVKVSSEQVGEAPKFKAAKFNKIKANATERDSVTQGQ